MIKVIAFDYGGVLEFGENPLPVVAKFLKIPVEEFKKIYFQNNHLCNTGEKSYEDVVIITANHFNKNSKEKEIRELIQKCFKKNAINYTLVKMIKTLKINGYKISLLSNNSVALRDILKKNNLYELFDSIVISGEIGYQKPNKEIFEYLFKELNVKANEVIFIDDTKKSLEKAQEIGYIPVLFENNIKLKKDLNKFKIKLN